jgi:hypothetical protein
MRDCKTIVTDTGAFINIGDYSHLTDAHKSFFSNGAKEAFRHHYASRKEPPPTSSPSLPTVTMIGIIAGRGWEVGDVSSDVSSDGSLDSLLDLKQGVLGVIRRYLTRHV